MPMRRISTSLPKTGFDDSASPMTEGMLHAASTLGELWPRLAQIKADQRERSDQRDERAREFDERGADRREAGLWRKQEFERRDRDRADHFAELNQTRQDAIQQRADANGATVSERKHHDDAEAARYGVYTGEDPQLKGISEAVRADRKGLADNAAADRKTKIDQGLDADALKRAEGEHAPHGRGVKLQMQTVTDANGNTRQQPIKVPMSDDEVRDQNDRINSRALELRGQGFKPVPGFKDPGEQPAGLWRGGEQGGGAPAAEPAPPGLWSRPDAAGAAMMHNLHQQAAATPPVATVAGAPQAVDPRSDEGVDAYLQATDPEYAARRQRPTFNWRAAVAAHRSGALSAPSPQQQTSLPPAPDYMRLGGAL